MLKFFSGLFKIVPSIIYTTMLMLFIRDSFLNVDSSVLKFIMVWVLPFFAILSVPIYFFYLREKLERQIAKESDENESGLFTGKIQTRRMIRKYVPLFVIGILLAIGFYLYKPYIIQFFINIGIMYSCFLFGEVLRIMDIGRKENKRVLAELKKGS